MRDATAHDCPPVAKCTPQSAGLCAAPETARPQAEDVQADNAPSATRLFATSDDWN